MDRSTSKSSEKEKLAETVKAVRGSVGNSTGQIGSSATLVRLANRLEKSVDALSLEIPEDVVRRTKYPVIEELQADGTIIYRHPVQVFEGARSR